MHLPKTEQDLQRFWSRVDRRGPDECWPWQGTVTEKGYGQISFGIGVSVRAHRLAFVLSHGPIPDDVAVCHSCDNPICCNYERHLWAGTWGENQYDKRRKGRAAKGEQNMGGGKLTATDIPLIREALADGDTKASIGRRFGVSATEIRFIASGRHWSHV